MSASVVSPRGPGELRQASGARLWTQQRHRQWPRLSPGVLCGVLHKPAGPQSATHSSLDAEVPAGATFQELPPAPMASIPCADLRPGDHVYLRKLRATRHTLVSPATWARPCQPLPARPSYEGSETGRAPFSKNLQLIECLEPEGQRSPWPLLHACTGLPGAGSAAGNRGAQFTRLCAGVVLAVLALECFSPLGFGGLESCWVGTLSWQEPEGWRPATC